MVWMVRYFTFIFDILLGIAESESEQDVVLLWDRFLLDSASNNYQEPVDFSHISWLFTAMEAGLPCFFLNLFVMNEWLCLEGAQEWMICLALSWRPLKCWPWPLATPPTGRLLGCCFGRLRLKPFDEKERKRLGSALGSKQMCAKFGKPMVKEQPSTKLVLPCHSHT